MALAGGVVNGGIQEIRKAGGICQEELCPLMRTSMKYASLAVIRRPVSARLRQGGGLLERRLLRVMPYCFASLMPWTGVFVDQLRYAHTSL